MRKTLLAATEERATEEARSRAAQDLHDGVLQTLVAAQMAFELDDVDHASALMDTAVGQARATVSALLPEDVEPDRLRRQQAASSPSR